MFHSDRIATITPTDTSFRPRRVAFYASMSNACIHGGKNGWPVPIAPFLS